MAQEITIKTALHPGIAPQTADSKITTYYSWNIGPRNLMAAMEKLGEHGSSMERGYGNVGHCGSWIEIAGVSMFHEDFSDYEFETNPVHFHDSYRSAISKTEWCKRFIASVLDGSLVAERKRNAEFLQSQTNAYNAGADAAYNGQPRTKYNDCMLDLESERGYEAALNNIEDDKQREQDSADREQEKQEKYQREHEASERKRIDARNSRQERNRQHLIAEVERIRAIDLSQPITDETLKSVIRSIAVVSFKHNMPLGQWKSEVLDGKHNDIVRGYLDTDWLFTRLENVVPREWEIGDNE